MPSGQEPLTAMRPVFAFLTALLVLAAGNGAVFAQPGETRCWSDWSAAAPVVRREALRPAKDATAIAQHKVPGRLLTISLCEDQGRYVYRMLILSAAGIVQTVIEDATPTPGPRQQAAATDRQ